MLECENTFKKNADILVENKLPQKICIRSDKILNFKQQNTHATQHEGQNYKAKKELLVWNKRCFDRLREDTFSLALEASVCPQSPRATWLGRTCQVPTSIHCIVGTVVRANASSRRSSRSRACCRLNVMELHLSQKRTCERELGVAEPDAWQALFK